MLDLLPPYLLKKAADFTSVPLSKLFNQSISTGTLSRDWITATVVSVFKQNSTNQLPTYKCHFNSC